MNHKLLLCGREWEWEGMGIKSRRGKLMGALIKLRPEWEGNGNEVIGMGGNRTRKVIPVQL